MVMVEKRTQVQLARGKAATVSGTSTVLIKLPSGTRRIDGGTAWFETPHFDDVVKVFVTDEDNVLGGGAGAIVSSYTDTTVATDNQGWFIPKHNGFAIVERLVDFGTLPGGFYIKVVGITGDNRSDTLRVNLHWGTPY